MNLRINTELSSGPELEETFRRLGPMGLVLADTDNNYTVFWYEGKFRWFGKLLTKEQIKDKEFLNYGSGTYQLLDGAWHNIKGRHRTFTVICSPTVELSKPIPKTSNVS